MYSRIVWPIVLAVALNDLAEAQRFQNPVLDGDYPDPGVILHEGVYYVVTTTNNISPEKFPIHASTDLQNWTFKGYVFNQNNFPIWSRTNAEFWAPELHRIGDSFNVYFTARDVEKDVLGIGVATSSSVLGPYTSLDQPLHVVAGPWAFDPTIVRYEGQLMLAWVENQYIRMRNLNDDGLSFKDNQTVQIFKATLPWEGATTEGPWYIFRNGYHYLFYSGNFFCTVNYAQGVARSSVSPSGPYEKLPYPILVSNAEFKGPGHGSIVRDTDGEGYVFVHHGYRAGAVCGDNPRLMFSSSVKWGDDDWPLNMTIGG